MSAIKELVCIRQHQSSLYRAHYGAHSDQHSDQQSHRRPHLLIDASAAQPPLPHPLPHEQLVDEQQAERGEGEGRVAHLRPACTTSNSEPRGGKPVAIVWRSVWR